MNSQLIDTVRQFTSSKKSILVIGDVMLDRYLMGNVNRISPEAPVPVVLLKQSEDRAGGAANVAANLSGLGLHTEIIGCIGDDTAGKALKQMIANAGIVVANIMTSTLRPTVSKTRVMSGNQQIVRIDDESAAAFSAEENAQLLGNVTKALSNQPAMVILSDYAKGVLSDSTCKAIIEHCKKLNIPVIADPKGRDYSKYKGASTLTPNKKETAEACGVDINDTEALLHAAEQLKNQLNLDFLAVTRGEEGISLIDDKQIQHIPATAKKVFDVSGAGDTVIATLAAGLAHGLNPHDALQLANIAAGIVVGKVGTVPVSQTELLKALVSEDGQSQADKICDGAQLAELVSRWKANQQKIVFTNGCFDLLHAGHVTYLEAAKKTGDKLVLGLNTDRSVSALKGPTRPVVHEGDRARVLAALASVDAVILFDEDTPLQLIDAIRPDVIVKGDDYTEDQVVGGTEVKSWGGSVKLIPLVQGRSTSNIIKKLGS
ncbi:bifunctional D-glycero-beta-D-manno-heptose-7-phosphate kinase/D-glycero-beta-D-manno-heptose 1-phosphate adenylyltransferase HldE [Methylotenera sp.]|uniref:bifunctional D-glycero-beta-D-manno-heptose-7-phosphate kinase/D-glycero-beta-D-manno-heptose 1-phosphate adenylyltransferase HldE n=1 Tax=Methylotenera sp. TaxID=2051956 RepID=UPI002488B478|nr:bifunctional D-glycero-beta-D-manno-heptose-7-phosphate kinase/D-glycero-beta-D-manno-heptose 1-phosphate adenylyltransferase HldE [Methylotenera sp.]MDI1297890.1 bifunctional D-glycero-beta-D-manno-heptose-7-phosphate kinase/D-glycero-beta-D-manno-heptose 1-phosphate adenylyltransferase HldE [Methylotenera sp.]